MCCILPEADRDRGQRDRSPYIVGNIAKKFTFPNFYIKIYFYKTIKI